MINLLTIGESHFASILCIVILLTQFPSWLQLVESTNIFFPRRAYLSSEACRLLNLILASFCALWSRELDFSVSLYAVLMLSSAGIQH